MQTRLLVIAGANGAIGSALLSAVMAQGDRAVIGVGRSPQPRDPSLYTSGARYFCLDLAINDGLDKLREALANPDLREVSWVHAVGHFDNYQPFLRQSIEAISGSVSSNLTTLVNAVHVWSNAAVRVRKGRFLAYSTVSLNCSFPLVATLNACKAATESLIASVSNEILISDVTLNCLGLPTVLTEVERRLKPRGDFEHWMTPATVAEISLARIDAKDGNYVRGTSIPVFSPSETYFGESVLTRFDKDQSDLIR